MHVQLLFTILQKASFNRPFSAVFYSIQENARLHAERGARAKQHSENLLLLQKDKVLEGEWSSSFNEWTTSLARLEECFDVLFPRVGVPENDVPMSSLSGKHLGSNFAGNAESTDDFEDVNWVGDEEDEGDAEAGASVNAHGGSYSSGGGDSSAGVAPYTLVSTFVNNHCLSHLYIGLTFFRFIVVFNQTIQLNTAARDLETVDNAVLVQTIRELSRVLARSAVPRLLHWKDLFAQCAALYTVQLAELHRAEELVHDALGEDTPMGPIDGPQDGRSVQATSSAETVATVLGKRGASSATQDPAASSVSPAVAKLVTSKNLVEQRLAQVISLLHNIRVMLTGKCRDLLKDEYV